MYLVKKKYINKIIKYFSLNNRLYSLILLPFKEPFKNKGEVTKQEIKRDYLNLLIYYT